MSKALYADIADGVAALDQAAIWFRECEAGHRAKGDDDKANRNRDRAAECENAAADLAKADPAAPPRAKLAHSVWVRFLTRRQLEPFLDNLVNVEGFTLISVSALERHQPSTVETFIWTIVASKALP